MGSRFTGDTKDPSVNVTAWLFMVIMIFSVTTRLGTKYHLLKKLMVDDLIIFTSLLFAIGQGIAISMAVSAGYGDHYNTISAGKADDVMKVRSLSFILILSHVSHVDSWGRRQKLDADLLNRAYMQDLSCTY
jgi:hypothetical protein